MDASLNHHPKDQDTTPDRCRIVLVVPASENAFAYFQKAILGGDIASIILCQGNLNTTAFQEHCEAFFELAQSCGIITLIENDSQVMGRIGADGLAVSGGKFVLKDAVEKFSPKKFVGHIGFKDRHQAMELGELRPDFLFAGKLDGDIKPEPHPKNIALAQWCAEVMQIPCIVMGGSSLSGLEEIAKAGIDFVALGNAIFSNDIKDASELIKQANAILDLHGVRFSDD